MIVVTIFLLVLVSVFVKLILNGKSGNKGNTPVSPNKEASPAGELKKKVSTCSNKCCELRKHLNEVNNIRIIYGTQTGTAKVLTGSDDC